jgi:hypothetical protein
MIRTFCLLTVGLALAVVALGGTTSCASAPGSVGCQSVDNSFANDFSFSNPDPVLYTDGAINGGSGGELVCCGSNETTDSFTITSGEVGTGGEVEATHTSNVGLWVTLGDTPLLINWVISTAPDGGGTVEGSGSGVSVTSTLHNVVGTSYDVYNASFSLGAVYLTAGTYYLELSGATTTPGGGGVFWDENGGTSTADFNGTPVVAESFEIDGFTGVPEPGTLGSLAAGLGFLGWLARRRKQA